MISCPSMQVTEVAREDPLQLSRNTVQEQTAVVAFTALYYSGLPFQVLALPMQSSLHSLLHPEAADWPLVPPSHEHSSAGTGHSTAKGVSAWCTLGGLQRDASTGTSGGGPA